ncbi:MAG: ATP-binding cassette domain-containing protein [candidate division KSB1 bacterium]|nr:ATP-binding cassette domain-containing protein [candidate division KSB1 bacterium]
MHPLPNYLLALSDGKKQRVTLARALANDPELILADELTANLDSETGHDVIGLLCRVAQSNQKTMLIISHDLRISDVATKVFHLEDGWLREDQKKHTVNARRT